MLYSEGRTRTRRWVLLAAGAWWRKRLRLPGRQTLHAVPPDRVEVTDTAEDDPPAAGSPPHARSIIILAQYSRGREQSAIAYATFSVQNRWPAGNQQCA